LLNVSPTDRRSIRCRKRKVTTAASVTQIASAERIQYILPLEFTTIAKIVNTEFGNNEFCLLDGDYMSSCHYPKLVHQPNDFYYRNGLAIKPINDCGNCY